MKRFYSIGLLVGIVMFFICGCGNTPVEDTQLSIQETEWSEQGSSKSDPVIYTPLSKGDLVYDDHFTKITVKSVDSDKIVLAIEGGMVEPEDDGRINLNADPLKKIELECGQSIELVSMSMSAGFNLVISYSGKSQVNLGDAVIESNLNVESTRGYFENLDKESSLEDIVADIGPYGVQGSGIIYHVWKLEDGGEAHVVFDSKGKIEMIYVIEDDNSERIYKREE